VLRAGSARIVRMGIRMSNRGRGDSGGMPSNKGIGPALVGRLNRIEAVLESRKRQI